MAIWREGGRGQKKQKDISPPTHQLTNLPDFGFFEFLDIGILDRLSCAVAIWREGGGAKEGERLPTDIKPLDHQPSTPF